jgi:hypothetical protein
MKKTLLILLLLTLTVFVFITIYPNPAKAGAVTLQLNSLTKGRYVVKVYNLAGQRLMEAELWYSGGRESKAAADSHY